MSEQREPLTLAKVWAHRKRDYSKEVIDDCKQCGEMSLCSYHSLLSELAEVMAAPPVASDGWQPLHTAPLCEIVLLWNPLWRHPFVGCRNGDFGQCWLYGLNNPESGLQDFATHWQPLPSVPAPPVPDVPQCSATWRPTTAADTIVHCALPALPAHDTHRSAQGYQMRDTSAPPADAPQEKV